MQISEKGKATLFAVFAAAFVLMGASGKLQAQTAGGKFVSVATGSGTVSLNELAGSITFCTGTVNTSGTPSGGKCLLLGTVTPAPNSATSLSLFVVSVSIVHVINNMTGQVTECGTMVVNGSPMGTCKLLGMAY